MKHFGLQLLAALSLILTAGTQVRAATRPQYGGTLRIALRESPTALDPKALDANTSPSLVSVTRLIFDTLVSTDDAGRIRPALAESWQSDASCQRWTFTLRPGVALSNGTTLTSDVVTASLRTSNPEWNVSPSGNSVRIQLASPQWFLPAALALPRNAIADRSGNAVVGSGPFQVTDWNPGRSLALSAREDYWAGRSYIDSVQVQFGVKSREQITALEVGKTHLAEVAPEAERVLSSPSRNISASLPLELVAIVFTRGTLSQDDSTLMEVLGQSLDRQSIKDVLLRGQGEVAGAILPQWAGGYEFLFPVTVDLRRARQLRGQLGRAGTWSLGYDASDPANQLLAERIALNAKDGGITLQPAATQNADLRLIRVYVASANPAVALTEMSRSLGLLSPKFADGSIHAVYQAELADVETRRVLPIIFIPASYLTSPALQNWRIHPDGTWDASNLWLKQGTP